MPTGQPPWGAVGRIDLAAGRHIIRIMFHQIEPLRNQNVTDFTFER
jgi:hypothetical protein